MRFAPPVPAPIVALGNYGYDWNGRTTEPLRVADAWNLADRRGTVPTYDRASGNWHFAYRERGRDHQVWLLDAVTAANQLRAASVAGRACGRAVALWAARTRISGPSPVPVPPPGPEPCRSQRA